MKNIILCLFLSHLMFSQAPSIQWQKCLGGTANDNIKSICQTQDGGYIVTGYSNSISGNCIGNHGSDDIIVIKLSATGAVEWNKALGGTSYERVYKILQTSEGGYILAGYTFSNNGDVTNNHGSEDVWIVKLNAAGDVVWQKTFGGTSQDVGRDIVEVSDGYMVAAHTYSNSGDVTGNHGTTDAWLLKLNLSGNLVWQKTYGGSSFDSAVSIQSTNDGGYIFTGTTNSTNGDVSGGHGNMDFWVVKISNTGILQWKNCFGGTADEESESIQQTNDGSYIIAGYTSSNNGNVTNFKGWKDYWIVKISSNGSILWEKSKGGSQEDYALKIINTIDNGYLVTGYTGSNDNDVLYNHSTSIPTLDVWIVKLNSDGNEVWQKSLGNAGYQDSSDIQQTSDGGFVIAANSGGGGGGDVTGFIGGNLDFWVVKLFPENLENDTFSNLEINVYPNPTENNLFLNMEPQNIKNISFFDSLGRKSNLNYIDNKLDLSNFNSGIYIIEIITIQNEIIRKKIIKK